MSSDSLFPDDVDADIEDESGAQEPIVLPVDEAGAGMRLDAFVAARLDVSRSRARELLEGATLDERPAKPSASLKAGSLVALAASRLREAQAPAPTSVTPELIAEAPQPCVLWEDDEMIVLDKPRGLTVHAGNGDTGATLVEVLRARDIALSSVGAPERAGIVHRLDRDTSGVMLAAKTDRAHWALARDFQERRIDKRYSALCCARPPLRGRIEAPIARHASNRTRMTVAPHGRFALTQYEVVRQWERFAWLDIELLTGRTHQIRVHLAHIGHPVVGDKVYGGAHRALDTAPHPAARAAIHALSCQALHARRIAFEHPVTRAPLSFESPLPPEIQAILDALDAPGEPDS